MKRRLYFLVAAAGALPVVATLVPLFRVDLGYVQVFDFPRLQIAAVLLLVLAISLAVGRLGRRWLLLDAALVGALALQAVQLLPYAPWWPSEVESRTACPLREELTVLIANLQMENREAGALRAVVREHRPDLFLAMETDAWWDRRLDPLAERFGHGIEHIGEHYFGIHLLSRLPLVEPSVRFVARDDTPALYTGVRLRSGELLAFRGLHPRPPKLGQSTAMRDREILAAAASLPDGRPGLLAGDLNAVPWEPVVAEAKRRGGLGDPRLGRGFLPTYHAATWLLSWPIDHILPTPGLRLLSLEVLPDIGSDHRPLLATFCHASVR